MRPRLAVALRLLEQDPLREDAHRAAMRAYCRLGQRHAALAQYARCQQTLQAELGAQPMAETRALRQAIVEGRLACEAEPADAAGTGGDRRGEALRGTPWMRPGRYRWWGGSRSWPSWPTAGRRRWPGSAACC